MIPVLALATLLYQSSACPPADAVTSTLALTLVFMASGHLLTRTRV